jgi:prepilin-type N-terminal cleavage/methylation domain-containing protein
MKYTPITKSAFTLIELVVAITIFSIIMVSVISIFIFSSELSGKIEINRTLQENIKNVIETIAEDVRKNGLVAVSLDSTSSCTETPREFTFGTKLCTRISEYYIAKESTP